MGFHVTFVQGPASQTLGLTGFGLLRASNTGIDTPTEELAQSLAQAVEALPGNSPAKTSRMVAQLRDSRTCERRAGVRGVVHLFSEEPPIRAGLIRNIESDPVLRKAVNAWNDVLWMSRVDGVMGFLESIPELDAETLVKIRLNMPSWTLAFSHSTSSPTSLSRVMGNAFHPLLKKLISRKSIVDERRFTDLMPFLFAYRAAGSMSLTGYMGPTALTKQAAMLFRALRRLKMTSDVPITVIDGFERRIFEWLESFDPASHAFGNCEVSPYECGPHGQHFISTRSALPIYQDILALTKPRDPLLFLKNDGISDFLNDRLARWLRRSFSVETKDGPFWGSEVDGMIRRREEALKAGLWAEFAASLFGKNFDSSEIPHEITEAIENYTEEEPGISIPSVRTHRTFSRDPYVIEGEEGTVFHSGLGRGTIEGEVDARGMVEVLFHERNHKIKVAQSSLVPADDGELLVEAMKARASNLSYLATYFAALAVPRYLAESDPAYEKLIYTPKKGMLINTILHRRKAREIDVVSGMLRSAGQLLGLDPIAWSMRLCHGVNPEEVLFKNSENGKAWQISMRPEMLGALHRVRPWQAKLNVDSETIRTAGHYYPIYYRGERNDDLTDLYFDYREGSASAFMKVADLMQPLIDLWAHAPHRSAETLLMPMIGTAPNDRLAEYFGYPSLFPWMPRPDSYGKGVEGRTLFQKIKMLEQALAIDPEKAAPIRNRSVLLIDDNVTDKATWMSARRLLFELGALEVGMVALTETIRYPEELNFSLR